MIIEINSLRTVNQIIVLGIHLTVSVRGSFNDDCGCNVTIVARLLQEKLWNGVLSAQPLFWIK